MRFVGKVEPSSNAWKKWRAEAIEKTKELIAFWKADGVAALTKHFSHTTVKNELWTIFGGKCSYCEIRLIGAQFGDVEHYRPKAGVRDTDNRPVKHPSKGEIHPGYFWLAYEWFNLLLACGACNKIRISKSGVKHGKGERFPLESPDRSFAPDDGIVEQPTLLSPWVDDPADHLSFDGKTGVITGRTTRGRGTIALLGLNREGLLDSRKETCDFLRGLYLRLFAAAVEDHTAVVDQLIAELETHRNGEKPFSATTASVIRELDEILTRVIHKAVA